MIVTYPLHHIKLASSTLYASHNEFVLLLQKWPRLCRVGR